MSKAFQSLDRAKLGQETAAVPSNSERDMECKLPPDLEEAKAGRIQNMHMRSSMRR